MGGYANGRIPLNQLVHLGANFYLPAGTAARWLWFVAEGKRRFGVTFRITGDNDGLGGWNAYRPYDAQVRYKARYGNMAASPGYSSHGGVYQGQEVFAIDVDNWAAVSWAQFSGLAAEAGFRTNFVTPTERWHIGDFNDPWTAPSFTQTAKEDDDVVKPFFDNSLRILWPTGYYASYPQVIYNALHYYFIDNPGNEQPGTVGTVQREIWAATDFMIQRQTNSVIKDIKAAGIPVDVDEKVIADAVVAAIGTPTVDVDYTKIAKDVRAEFRTDPLVAS